MSEEAQSEDALSNLSHEDRRFPPPEDLAATANVTEQTYERGRRRPRTASGPSRPSGSAGTPSRPRSLDWSNPPFAKWFADGTLNAAYNCCDRHVEAGHGDRVAFYFEGEPGDTRTITYAELTNEVKQAANALIELGVKAGRPGGDLSADDPRGGGRHAGLRPDRRTAHGRLRRLLRRRAVLPDPGLRGRGRDHRRRRLPPGRTRPR